MFQSSPCRSPLRLLLLLLVLAPLSLPAQDQPFDKAEYAARRTRLLDSMPDGIAVIIGAEMHPYNVRFRQAPDFYYLTGIEEPGAVLVLNGASRNVALFAPSGRAAALPAYQKYGYSDAYEKSGRYIGHFVGISVHDVGGIFGPWADKPFVSGVVFNVEPILEFSDRGVHLRLEDTVLVTDTGSENLTAGVPAGVDAVLALVREKGINERPMALPR